MSHVDLAPDLNTYFDLSQYPLNDLDSPHGQALIARCQDMLRKDSICALPGFLRPEIVEVLAAELTGLAPLAHPSNRLRTPYGWRNNAGFTPAHPRSALFRTACGIVTTEQFSEGSHSRVIFHFDELTECIRRILGFTTLYRCACPTLSIQVNVLREGETFGWHFDTNDGVVSFIIQEADTGGAFEYAPMIRAENDENYEAVGRIFREETSAKSLSIPPGTLVLFLGRRSVHRVAPVGKTQKPRLSLLYSYDQQPGMRFPEKTCQSILHPSAEPYLGSSTASR